MSANKLDLDDPGLAVDSNCQSEAVPLDVEDCDPVAFADWPGHCIMSLRVARVLPIRRDRLLAPRPESASRFLPSLVRFDEAFDPFYRYGFHRPVAFLAILAIANLATLMGTGLI